MRFENKAAYEAYHAERVALAETKRKTFKTWDEWIAHREKCVTCQGPWLDCAEGMAIIDQIAKETLNDMPDWECPTCEAKNIDNDYSETKEGSEMVCDHCGMKCKVTSVDWTVHLKIEETGTYEPSYLVPDETKR